jgi:hypothetical protein
MFTLEFWALSAAANAVGVTRKDARLELTTVRGIVVKLMRADSFRLSTANRVVAGSSPVMIGNSHVAQLVERLSRTIPLFASLQSVAAGVTVPRGKSEGR